MKRHARSRRRQASGLLHVLALLVVVFPAHSSLKLTPADAEAFIERAEAVLLELGIHW